MFIKIIWLTIFLSTSAFAESGSVDEVSPAPVQKNGFGGSATSISDAESEIKKSKDKSMKELEDFNKNQKTEIDCNKLFKAYADTATSKACELMERQHPTCNIRCDFKKDRKLGKAEQSDSSSDPEGPKMLSQSVGDQYAGSRSSAAIKATDSPQVQIAKAKAKAQSVQNRNAASTEEDDSAEEEDDQSSSSPKSSSVKKSRTADSDSSQSTSDSPDGSSQSKDASTQDGSTNGNQASTTKPATNANAEADAVTDCKAQRDAAISACAYTDETDSASDSTGLTNTCDQMRDKGLKSSKAKSEAARTCIAKYNACSTSCNWYADHYYDGDNVYTFHAVAVMCQSLSSRADDLNTASSTSISASDSGLNCMSNASDSSGSGGGGKGEDSAAKMTAAKQQAAADACTTNPQSQECIQAKADQYMAARKAVGQFNQLDTSKGSADVVDGSGLNVNPGGALSGSTAAGGGAKNGTIANNSGGGIPGGGGSASQSSTGAAGRPGGDARPGDALPNPVAVALGGYAPILNGENPWGNQSLIGVDPARIKRAIASLDVDQNKIEIDLKRYLPGGDLAPPPPNPYDIQYHAKMVDIFERISIRYEVKCRLRLMVGCENGIQ